MKKALILLSGGQDSATCLLWAKKRFWKVRAITFDYGQRHRIELKAAKKIADTVKIPLKIQKIGFFKDLTDNALTNKDLEIKGGKFPSTFVPGRNLIFLSIAAIYAREIGIQDLVIGVCEADFSGYPDCRNDFIKAFRKTLNLAMDLKFKIHAPLMKLTKAETVELMRELGGINLLKHTRTCYKGGGKACGICPACKLRLNGFKKAGVRDPIIYENE